MLRSDEVGSRKGVSRTGWLVLAAAAGISALLAVLMPSTAPYTAEGAIWIDSESVQPGSPGMPASNAWVELLRSARVLDPIAERAGMEPVILSDRLRTRLDGSGQFLRLSFTDPSAEKAATVLDAVMEQHVDVATELGLVRLDEVVATLEEQLRAVEDDLLAVERALDRPLSDSEAARLGRRLHSTEAIHSNVSLRVEEARMESRTWIPPVRILDRATVSRPERSVPQIGLILALLATFLLSLGRALTVGASDHPGGVGMQEQALQLLIVFAAAAAALIATVLIG